ncbi:MAG: hypothetical protein NUV80_05065 [Candidatus Berkelbacteria bacterium]|nr:hypothetical protein [Candidatus Berkelbacteria bacterium]MCR4307908.1 hypothetical protein [Candidatus Berkelbacteria bacterium]
MIQRIRLLIMDVHNEVGTGLKASLLMFVLVLVGTLVYFVVQQNDELFQIYAAQDVDTVLTRQSVTPNKVDSTQPAP